MATPAKRLFRPLPSPARPSRPATSPTYRPRRPTATPLYPVVQHHLETFLAHAAEADPLGNGVPWWVEKDFRGYLRCGVLAHGFARARCEDCGHERLIPFSGKGRGICPSCNTRRMAELAAHLTDHVLPHLPIRQWVLSVPKRLRPFLHHNPDIAGAVLRDHASRGALLRAIRTTLRHASPGAPSDAQLGAVSFLHRFGSSLNAHPHFHVVVLDGVFSRREDGEAHFREASLFQPEHWLRLQGVLQRRVLRYFRNHGLLDELHTLDMLSWQGSGGFSIDAGPPRNACIAWGRAPLCASRVRTAPASSASCAIVPARPSLSNAFMPSPAWHPWPLPTRAFCIGFPNPGHPPKVGLTGAPRSSSRLSSSSSASLRSCHRRACTATATTASWRPMPACAPSSSLSVDPRPRCPALPMV